MSSTTPTINTITPITTTTSDINGKYLILNMSCSSTSFCKISQYESEWVEPSTLNGLLTTFPITMMMMSAANTTTKAAPTTIGRNEKAPVIRYYPLHVTMATHRIGVAEWLTSVKINWTINFSVHHIIGVKILFNCDYNHISLQQKDCITNVRLGLSGRVSKAGVLKIFSYRRSTVQR